MLVVFLFYINAIEILPNPLMEMKKPATFVTGFFLRRKRDSNPRRCYPQQFSRLPQSTTLPFLPECSTGFPDCACKYRKLFGFCKIFLFFFKVILNPSLTPLKSLF